MGTTPEGDGVKKMALIIRKIRVVLTAYCVSRGKTNEFAGSQLSPHRVVVRKRSEVNKV